MNARMLRGRFATLLFGIGLLAAVGCSNSESTSSDSNAYAASGGIPPAAPDPADTGLEETTSSNEALKQLPLLPDAGASTTTPDVNQLTIPTSQVAPGAGAPQASAPADAENAVPSSPFTLAEADDGPTPTVPQRELRANLSNEELLEFLGTADQDMQVIASGRSGIEDPKKARDTLIHIVKMKLEASRRLASSPDADDATRSEGARGELQSLSHLAALGDLKVAEQLEELAKKNLESNDARLASDSRLVLIGFAIESLQNGEAQAADQIVDYVDQIATSSAPPDVPTMMVMGQARQLLTNYGHAAQAKKVREAILELFAGSADPEIAQMAAQVAGNVQFDEIVKLRENAMKGETVSAEQWTKSVEALIDEAPDMQTVQYLAGTALEFESVGKDELVDATFDVMAKRFSDPKSATTRETQLAVAARQARHDVIGRMFDPDLPSADGTSLSFGEYRGKVVLMPFWATGFPQSMQLLPRLKSLRDSDPENVAIVGMNLDVAGTPMEEFMAQNDLGFRSFWAESSPTAQVANPVAARFGMVSMPFTVIIDQEGRVAAVNFTGRDMEKTVNGLLKR